MYNAKNYLRETIDSLINQTYKNLEIILINDGSTDDSGEICEEYAAKDKRVRVFHQSNKGVSATRNAGLDLMTGDFVAFLDSDDAYQPNCIEKMMDAMTRAEADIVACKYTEQKTIGQMSLNGREKIYPPIKPGSYDTASARRKNKFIFMEQTL